MDKTNLKYESQKATPLASIPEEIKAMIHQMGYNEEDYYEQFPCFLGPRQIARFISFFEYYQMTLGLAGHMAEVGMFRGAVSMYLTKLSMLYEPNSITQVHGFDWFQPPAGEEEGATDYYYEPYERLQKLVNIQGLQNYLHIHKMNVITELKPFFEDNSHLQFKLVFLDAGNYDVVANCINEFWPRLCTGGILVLDQFNHEVAPGETQAVKDLLPSDAIIRTSQNGWMPTAYVVKGQKLEEVNR